MRSLWRQMGLSADRIRLGTKLLRQPLAYRVLLRGVPKELPTPQEAPRRALDWVLASHAAAAGRGFASHYSLVTGWGPPYPETSGYLVPTLTRAMGLDHRGPELRSALEATGRWLLDIQHGDGSFDAPATGESMVFDTGQAIFGLLSLREKGERDLFSKAAIRAGDWMLERQESDGSWIRNAYRGIPHTYYSRASWALAELFLSTGEDRFRAGALRNLAWVLRQQRDDGWFDACSFLADQRAVLHVVAYTIEGVWELSLFAGDTEGEKGALRAAEALLRLEAGRGWLESHFGPGWEPSGSSVCITGLCQMSLIWLRMARRYGRAEFRQSATRCLEFVRRHMARDFKRMEIDGGLWGSIPIWGEYFPWALPNWGTKFFIDALLEMEGIEGAREVCG